MRNLLLFGLLIILLLAAQFTKTISVDEVIKKYLRARGGKNKLASVKSIYMEGARQMKGKEVIVKITREQDKLSRTEIETGVANGFVLITDKGAWTFFPLRSPAIEKIHEEDLSGLQTEMDIAGPLANYIAKGHQVKWLGKDSVEGNTCYKIILTTRAGQEIVYWVDASTFLLYQSYTSAPGGVGTATFTLYRDYKPVDGIQFAHTLETYTTRTNAGDIGGELIFYKILVNPIIDPKMYLPV